VTHTIPGFLDKVGDLWCRCMHDEYNWPMHGKYRCRTCFRERVVPWADDSTIVVQQGNSNVNHHGAEREYRSASVYLC